MWHEFVPCQQCLHDCAQLLHALLYLDRLLLLIISAAFARMASFLLLFLEWHHCHDTNDMIVIAPLMGTHDCHLPPHAVVLM